MARRRRRIGNIQHLVLDCLIPSKRDYAAGPIGGAGRTNFDVQSTRAGDQARAQLAVQGGKSKQPDSRTSLFDLIEMHCRDPIPEDEVVFFSLGEHITLDERVYDLRCALVRAAAKAKQFERETARATPSKDRTGQRGHYWRVEPKFRISFMRAAAILVKRGLLIRQGDDNSTQLRFVSMRDDIERQCRAEHEPITSRKAGGLMGNRQRRF